MGTTYCYSTNSNSRGKSSSTYITSVQKMVHIYTTEKTIHQFSIGYMINPSLHDNMVFREQVQKLLGCSFSTNTMKNIRDCLLSNNTSVMALINNY